MAQNLTDNWQIDKILTANWHLQSPNQTLWKACWKTKYFAFTTQPNTLKGWGMGALVNQAQDRKLKVGLELTETEP